MAYERTVWKDHVTEYQNRYRETQNSDGTVTHEKVEGEIIQQGTPQSATNFNNMEDGIQENFSVFGVLLDFVRLKLGHSNHTLESLEEALSAADTALQTAITDGTITAAQAQTLTQTLGIALGGTGGTTAEAARTNLAVPSSTELLVNLIHQSAEHSVRQAVERDHESRLITVEAQLAALT